MVLGLIGSAVAYFGLWLESDMAGLIGWGAVGIAMLGGLVSLFWYAGASTLRYIKAQSKK